MVRCLNKDCAGQWDLYLTYVASAIRAIKNKHTGFSANRMMLGREISRPLEVLYGLPPELSSRSEGAYLAKLDEVMHKAHEIARRNIRGNLMRQKRDYDKAMFVENYNVGDFVYRLRGTRKKTF